MNFIIFDLEFNQGFDFSHSGKVASNTKCPFEIIEIGAIKLNEQLKPIDTFHSYIKPEIYTQIHPFVKQITKIDINQLMNSLPFNDVYKTFINFINSKHDIFCVWGTVDLKELYRNALYHRLHKKKLPQKYIDIQSLATTYLNNPNGKTIGLKNAAELLKIPLDIEFHNALHDATYTAKIFKKVYTNDISYKIYNYSSILAPKSMPPKKVKKTLDKRNLFLQFEKMFNRKLTHEEKEMIKLAYKMGQTNQFIINTKNKT